jgi:hypothetical protein
MRARRSLAWVLGLTIAAGLVGGCEEDPVGNGPGGGTPPLPFKMLDIALRPLAIEVPPTSGRPTPALAAYNLTAFTEGGTVASTFDWTVPGDIGTVVPKTPQLTIHDAAVFLRPRDDGSPPLGFFTISVEGQNANESGSLTRRFAVVRNTWMKHQRTGWSEPEPEDPVASPLFKPTQGAQDSIFFVATTNSASTRIRRISAFAALNGGESATGDGVLVPTMPEGNNFASGAQLSPDFSPVSLGRSEMLFASNMDSQFGQRCPIPAACNNPAPTNLWVVRAATGIGAFFPRQITWDSTFVEIGRTRWFAFNFEHPRWDPSATGPAARIAFLSNHGGAPALWTALLHDTDGDGASDSLDTYRHLIDGTITGFAWHPDGTRLCVVRGGLLEWVDAATGAVTPISVPDRALGRFLSPSVYVGPGQPTPLIAFQAQAENRANIFVLDEAAGTLTRILPFAAPVTHNLFPRWHPSRKAIVYVGDYTVALWANSSPPGMNSIPDIPATPPSLEGMPRSKFPSPWVIELE